MKAVVDVMATDHVTNGRMYIEKKKKTDLKQSLVAHQSSPEWDLT